MTPPLTRETVTALQAEQKFRSEGWARDISDLATALLAAWDERYITDKLLLSEANLSLERLSRAEAAEAKLDAMTAAWGEDAVRVEELTAALAERDAETTRLREGLTMFTAIWSRPYYAGHRPSRDDDIDAAVSAARALLNKELTK